MGNPMTGFVRRVASLPLLNRAEKLAEVTFKCLFNI